MPLPLRPSPLNLVAIVLLAAARAWAAAPFVDHLQFGVTASEQAHALKPAGSEVIAGGLGEPARRLLPPATENWRGGSVAFRMKVDPDRQNYLTVRLWGSDLNENRLILLCEGRQVGYRHLGDIDILDTPNGEPGYNGRFFYVTTPLPRAMTKGKTQLNLEIFSTGPIWGYGQTFDKYQKPMKTPSRGIYRAYLHTDTGFVPPADEKQGPAPLDPPARGEPGEAVLGAVKERVSREIKGLLAADKPLNQLQLWFLSKAWHVGWTPSYHDDALVKRAVEALDALYLAYRADPKIAQAEPSIYNASWFGLGPAGSAISLLARPLQPFLDQKIAGADGVTRRAGWSAMLQACRDWHRENRREYTNQSMINDTFGIYLANRGIAVLEPKNALPEARALRYLHESVGLEPWLGSEKEGRPEKPLGERYFQLTSGGLTKELGFVGYYGEVLDWMTTMYDATRPQPGQPGDPGIKAQLVKAAKARAAFRAPALDDEGNRAMRAETIVGWRDAGHYPGDVTYGQRPTWDSSAIECAAATLDPDLVGYAQQMFADNQFFATVADAVKGPGLRGTAGLLAVPDDYATLMAQPASAKRLPMTKGQPDFVFADPEDGVVAIKHGDEVFYASLYWRARNAINNLARVHLTTPRFDRIATVYEDTKFDPSGLSYKRLDWINMGFANGGLKYPGEMHSAHTGEVLPIARIPAGVAFQPGDESVYAGKGTFYTLRYGPYLIAMNTTADRTFDLRLPADLVGKTAPELVSGRSGPVPAKLAVAPRSTVVFRFQP